MISTMTQAESSTSKTSAPAPAKKKEVAQQPTPKPAPKVAATAPKQEAKPEPQATPPAPKSLSSIIVMDEVTLGALATKHGTTTEQLNALNNWNYKSDLVLARGSEVYVPSS